MLSLGAVAAGLREARAASPAAVPAHCPFPPSRLANKVGADARQVSRNENGRLTPSVAAVVRLAEALNVSVDYLVVEGAPRRPLPGPDLDLGERLADLGQLDEDDRTAVLRIVDGLLAKNRVKVALDAKSRTRGLKRDVRVNPSLEIPSCRMAGILLTSGSVPLRREFDDRQLLGCESDDPWLVNLAAEWARSASQPLP